MASRRTNTTRPAAVAAIDPDRVLTVDIKPAADSLMAAVLAGGTDPGLRHHFILGNVKARQRIVAQYAMQAPHPASSSAPITPRRRASPPSLSGGASDVLPLAGHNKRRIRAVAAAFGVPNHLVWKVPTADLEPDAPLRPDDDVYGATWD